MSTVMDRFPLTMALIRFIGTRRARANSLRLTLISWSSSLSSSPGCMGGSFLVLAFNGPRLIEHGYPF